MYYKILHAYHNMNDVFHWPPSKESLLQLSTSPPKEFPINTIQTPYISVHSLSVAMPHSLFGSLQKATRIIEKRKLNEQKYRYTIK